MVQLRISTVTSIGEIDPAQWDACTEGKPFLRHAFFAALEHSGTAIPDRGIAPEYLLLRDAAGRLLGCAPAMRKTGTLAEYGPEYRWLRAGIAQGCFAWPKYQCGVPMFPIRGPRLLVHPSASREALEPWLLRGLEIKAKQHATQALNLMQVEAPQAQRLQAQGWLLSHELHGFWRNDGWRCHEDYLASLPHAKRYKTLRERAKFRSTGLEVKVLRGEEISPDLAMNHYDGHVAVCTRHRNHPWLPPQLYSELIARMPESVRMIAAFDQGVCIASVFCLVNEDTLYLRTWSAHHALPMLVIELICHQPRIHAIDEGLALIDSGLNGEHKRARGFMDTPVASAHRFFDPRLAALANAALADPAAERVRPETGESRSEAATGAPPVR